MFVNKLLWNLGVAKRSYARDSCMWISIIFHDSVEFETNSKYHNSSIDKIYLLPVRLWLRFLLRKDDVAVSCEIGFDIKPNTEKPKKC